MFCLCFSIILLQSSFVIAQPIPLDQFAYKSKKLIYDSGKDWQSITNFGPLRYGFLEKRKAQNSNNQSFYDVDIMFTIANEFTSINGFGRSRYNDFFFAYLFPELVNETSENNQPVLGALVSGNYGSNSGLVEIVGHFSN